MPSTPPSTVRADVFISYSHEDKLIADAACAALEQQHIRCWIAPRDVRPGEEWGEAIVEAIRSSRVMVLVFSSRTNASRQVRQEVDRAAHHELPIVPFRIEAVTPEGALEFHLSATHWLDALTPPIERHLGSLTQTVKAILSTKAVDTSKRRQSGHGRKPDDVPPEPKQSQPTRRLFRVFRMAAVLAVVALLAGLAGAGIGIIRQRLTSTIGDDARYYYSRGLARSREGRHDEAIADFTEVIRRDPEAAYVFDDRARSFGRIGEYGRSLDDPDEAIRLNPREKRFYYTRGQTYNLAGQYWDAIDDFNEVLRRDLNDANAYAARSYAYEQIGDMPRARADEERAAALSRRP